MTKQDLRKTPYLLFDAGGTLVFPDQARLAEAAREAGATLEPEALFAECHKVIYDFDLRVREQGWWEIYHLRGYLKEIYGRKGMRGEALERAVEEAVRSDRERSLWCSTRPWVAEGLERLRAAGWRMSVISNADGRVAAMLEELGLAGYFERIFDSAILGIEKPDPAIFHHALAELGLRPEDTLYVGDIYHVDVLGANRAGVAAVHLDLFGSYEGWPGARLRDVGELAAWLENGAKSMGPERLFPLKDFPISPSRRSAQL